MKKIHNRGEHKFRQPVILETGQLALWMNESMTEDILVKLMFPVESHLMEMHMLARIGDDQAHTGPIWL